MAHIAMVLRGDIRYDGRVRKEIRSLVDAGHQIDLVVSDYHSLKTGGEDLDATIHYVPMRLRPSPSGNFVEQLKFNRRAAAIIERIKPSHIHCHDLCSLLAGVWAKRKTTATLVFDAHELMPESLWGLKERVWNVIEGYCIKHCDGIIMPEKNRIMYFKAKYPKIPEPILVPNFPRRMDLPTRRIDIFRESYPIKRDQTIVLYTGLVGSLRHIEDLVESMTLCDEKFVLIVMGRAFKGYDEFLRKRISDLGLTDRIFLHPPVLSSEILRYMASCDIGTAFYRNTDLNNYYCASNKVFEYIALAKPLVTNNYPGLLEAVERFGQGVCLEEITPASLAAAFVRACDQQYVEPGSKRFYWEEHEKSLLRFYQSQLWSARAVAKNGNPLPLAIKHYD